MILKIMQYLLGFSITNNNKTLTIRCEVHVSDRPSDRLILPFELMI